MKVYISSQGPREKLLRESLEGDYQTAVYRPREEEPVEGEVLVLDLADEGSEWQGRMSGLRSSLPEGVKVLAVLRLDQLAEVTGEAPVDDFVLAGSTAEEIRARVRRLAGEGKGTVPSRGLVIDEDRYQVRVDGTPVELTFKEFELLRFLASRPGKVFTRQVLLEQVWGYDYFGGTRTVDVHIRRIRSKIEREGRTYIRTIRGVGYAFEPLGVDPS